MKIFLAIFFLSTFGHAVQLNCWDESFAFNQVSLIEANGRMELSLKGSLIGPLKFYNHVEGTVMVPSWNNRHKIHVAFNKEECTFADDGKKGRCEKISTDRFTVPRVFIERSVVDLGRSFVEVITPAKVSKVVLDYNVGGDLRLEFHGADTESDMQASVIKLSACDEPMPDKHLRFPARLVEYLK